jgi:hypothetical protein
MKLLTAAVDASDDDGNSTNLTGSTQPTTTSMLPIEHQQEDIRFEDTTAVHTPLYNYFTKQPYTAKVGPPAAWSVRGSDWREATARKVESMNVQPPLAQQFASQQADASLLPPLQPPPFIIHLRSPVPPVAPAVPAAPVPAAAPAVQPLSPAPVPATVWNNANDNRPYAPPSILPARYGR